MKPILFNTQMVKAILEGKKTVTRRIVKFLGGKNPNWTGYIKDGLTLYNGTNEPCIRKPPYEVDQILYVRETYSEWMGGYVYKAWVGPFHQVGCYSSTKWIPSIYMPKEAARIFLKVKSVRLERLQEIDEEDAKSEGANAGVSWSEKLEHSSVERFKDIWNSTIKKADFDIYGWDANPWVWVIEFEQCDKPIE